MIRKPKYNIGDEVYILDFYKYTPIYKGFITEIIISCTGIEYKINSNYKSKVYDEYYLSKTKKLSLEKLNNIVEKVKIDIL